MQRDETAAQHPRWLTDDEQAAWRAYIVSSLRLMAVLDRDLQQKTGLPMSYYEILVLLSEAPDRELRMTELAEATHSLPSRISHAISRMEKSGLIERRNCPGDRRIWYAHLTEEGYRVVTAAAPLHVSAVREHLIDHLDGKDLEDLHRVFSKVRTHLDSSWGEYPNECPDAGAASMETGEANCEATGIEAATDC